MNTKRVSIKFYRKRVRDLEKVLETIVKHLFIYSFVCLFILRNWFLIVEIGKFKICRVGEKGADQRRFAVGVQKHSTGSNLISMILAKNYLYIYRNREI